MVKTLDWNQLCKKCCEGGFFQFWIILINSDGISLIFKTVRYQNFTECRNMSYILKSCITTQIDSSCYGEVNQRHAKRGLNLNGKMIHWRLNVENSTHLHFDQGHMELKRLGKSIVLEWPSSTHMRVFNYWPKSQMRKTITLHCYNWIHRGRPSYQRKLCFKTLKTVFYRVLVTGK